MRSVLYEHVMGNLRRQIRLLEENELFERTLLQQSQVAQSPLPSTNDLDALMRSMMGYSNTSPPPQQQAARAKKAAAVKSKSRERMARPPAERSRTEPQLNKNGGLGDAAREAERQRDMFA